MTFPFVHEAYEITPQQMFENLKEFILRNNVGSDKVLLNLNSYERTIDGISNFFTEDVRVKCVTGKGNISPFDWWNKTKHAKEVLTLPIHDQIGYIWDNRINFCNIFRPTVYALIIKNLGGGKILDPSAGWGDRLIASLASPFITEYRGFDPSEQLEERYKNIIKILDPSKSDKMSVEKIAFEKVSQDRFNSYFDISFTSPPFYDLEDYSASGGDQSYKGKPSYEDWLKNFYTPYIMNMIRMTKKGGYLVLYVSDYKDKNYKFIPFFKDTVSIILNNKLKSVKREKDFVIRKTSAEFKSRDRNILCFKVIGEKSKSSIPYPLHSTTSRGSPIPILRKIFDLKADYEKKEWTIPRDKLTKKSSVDYPLLNLVLPLPDNEWDLNLVSDYYTELARVSSPGYGEKKSSVQNWLDFPSPSKTFEETREKLAKEIQEPRFAYSTVSKRLYKCIIDEFLGGKTESVNILDISAFGERAIAASSLGVKSYTGLDPDLNLAHPVSILKSDLKSLNPSTNLDFIHTGIESASFPREYFDIFTVSPPPYIAEPYGGEQTSQTHNRYPTFDKWFKGFVIETIYRAEMWVRDGGIFAFTALDRLGTGRDKGKTQISYVEPMLMVCEIFGFSYIGAIGLKSTTPWWIFQKKRSERYEEVLKQFTHFYGNLVSGLIENKLKRVKKIETPDFTNVVSLVVFDTTPEIELARKKLFGYLVTTFWNQSESDVKRDKYYDRLSRLVSTLNGITLQFLDPLFPQIEKINDDLIPYITENKYLGLQNIPDFTILTPDLLYHSPIVFETIEEIFFECAHFMDYIQNVSSRSDKSLFLTHSTPGNIDVDLPVLSSSILMKRNFIVPSSLETRYDALGAKHHHFTRSKERIRTIEKEMGECVTDVFATSFNTNSGTFFSPFYDLERSKGSLGSALTANLKKGVWMCNPLDSEPFLIETFKKMKEWLTNSNPILFCSFTLWKDTDLSVIESVKRGETNDLENSTNMCVHLIGKELINKVQGVYILDSNKFYPVDLDGKKVVQRDTVSSVGIVLANKSDIKISRTIRELSVKV